LATCRDVSDRLPVRPGILKRIDPMIKNAVTKIAGAMGYRVTRTNHSVDDAFHVMQRLMKGVTAPVIFDVGAHVGHTSRKFREICSSSKVYAFEPFHASFAKLDECSRTDPSIISNNFGLGDGNGTRDFRSNGNSETNSLLATDERGSRTWRTGVLETREIVRAEFRTLDSMVSSSGLQKIDILKLDVQGAESLVMAGAAETCKRRMIDVIYTEIIIQPTYVGQKRLDECLSIFYGHGFDLHDFYNHIRSPEGRLIQVDAIFVKNPD
jgi:FkbM family methyltransferase